MDKERLINYLNEVDFNGVVELLSVCFDKIRNGVDMLREYYLIIGSNKDNEIKQQCINNSIQIVSVNLKELYNGISVINEFKFIHYNHRIECLFKLKKKILPTLTKVSNDFVFLMKSIQEKHKHNKSRIINEMNLLINKELLYIESIQHNIHFTNKNINNNSNNNSKVNSIIALERILNDSYNKKIITKKKFLFNRQSYSDIIKDIIITHKEISFIILIIFILILIRTFII
jgi:hypothetical protein